MWASVFCSSVLKLQMSGRCCGTSHRLTLLQSASYRGSATSAARVGVSVRGRGLISKGTVSTAPVDTTPAMQQHTLFYEGVSSEENVLTLPLIHFFFSCWIVPSSEASDPRSFLLSLVWPLSRLTHTFLLHYLPFSLSGLFLIRCVMLVQLCIHGQ